MSDRYLHPVDPATLMLVDAGSLVGEDVIPQIAGRGRGEFAGQFFFFKDNSGYLEDAQYDAKIFSTPGLQFVTGPGIDDELTMRRGRVMFDHNTVGLWIQVARDKSEAFGRLMENGGRNG